MKVEKSFYTVRAIVFGDAPFIDLRLSESDNVNLLAPQRAMELAKALVREVKKILPAVDDSFLTSQ